jgi:hypothetical protein
LPTDLVARLARARGHDRDALGRDAVIIQLWDRFVKAEAAMQAAPASAARQTY